MAIEFLLFTLAGVVFGGMFLGLLLSYRATEADRAKAVMAAGRMDTSAFQFWHRRDPAPTEDLMLRWIEHHLRQEELLAEQFVMDPSPDTLRAGGYSRPESINLRPESIN